MQFSSPTPVRLACLFGLALTLGACSSGPPKRGDGPPGGAMMQGQEQGNRINGPVARPVALLLAGMDADHDMRVTRNEVDAMSAVEWNRLARGADTIPALDLAEWLRNALGSPDAQPSPVAFDNNFDGRISREEFRSRLFALFAELDKSGDEMLTRTELLYEPPITRRRNETRMLDEGPRRQRQNAAPQ